jgi:NOL1/NOP2/fmu family ribosome biogenesis protein
MKFLKSTEKKKLLKELENLFGISSLPDYVIKKNKEEFNIFSGNLNKELLIEFTKMVRVEEIGLPIIKKTHNETKLTFDSLNILNPSQPILEINEVQYRKWIRGHDLDLNTKKGLVILKYGDYFVGLAKSQDGKVFNSVPKDRRVKDFLL